MANDTIWADMILAQQKAEKEKQAREEAMAPVEDMTRNKKLEYELANAKTLHEQEAILVTAGLAKDSRRAWEKPIANTPMRKTSYSMAEANLKTIEKNPKGSSMYAKFEQERIEKDWDEQYGPVLKTGGRV